MLGRKVLSDKYVTKLYNIFEKKNWKIWEEGDSSVFDRFCERLVEKKRKIYYFFGRRI